MTALITPFKDGKLDEIGYEKLIKRQIANGIDAVIPVGTTGESATLTHDEHRICIEIAVQACKNTSVKVLAGAGSNATHEAVGLAKFAETNGADGILSVAPYYNKPKKGFIVTIKRSPQASIYRCCSTTSPDAWAWISNHARSLGCFRTAPTSTVSKKPRAA